MCLLLAYLATKILQPFLQVTKNIKDQFGRFRLKNEGPMEVRPPITRSLALTNDKLLCGGSKSVQPLSTSEFIVNKDISFQY